MRMPASVVWSRTIQVEEYVTPAVNNYQDYLLFCIDLHLLITLIRYLADLRRRSENYAECLGTQVCQIHFLTLFCLGYLQFTCKGEQLICPLGCRKKGCYDLLPSCFGIRPANCQRGSERTASFPYSGRFSWGWEYSLRFCCRRVAL